jgi:hypothetical protein
MKTESHSHEAETTLRDMLRWVDMSLELAKTLKFSIDADSLREGLLIELTQNSGEFQYDEAMRTVEEVAGIGKRRQWEKRFELPNALDNAIAILSAAPAQLNGTANIMHNVINNAGEV